MDLKYCQVQTNCEKNTHRYAEKIEHRNLDCEGVFNVASQFSQVFSPHLKKITTFYKNIVAG